MEIQARLPVALAAIHNFTQKHKPDGAQAIQLTDGEARGFLDDDEAHNADEAEEEEEERTEMQVKRDQIAQEMWESYQHVLAQRLMEDPDSLDDDEDDEDASL
jgi:glucosamine 6-phosphate synthetase-like amidotransferase/phosphosugar isomerase protein